MPSVLVRAFRESDEARVIELWMFGGLIKPWNDPKKDIARKLKVQRDLFLVAELEGVVVGVVMAGYEGHRGWVNYLAVDIGQRRRGIGTALMRDAERRLRRKVFGTKAPLDDKAFDNVGVQRADMLLTLRLRGDDKSR